MSNHTPPPWTVECVRGYGYYYIQEVAAEQAVSGAGSDCAVIRGRDKANAILIAAAPKMLAALKAARLHLDRNERIHGQVMAAIAEAEAEAEGKT